MIQYPQSHFVISTLMTAAGIIAVRLGYVPDISSQSAVASAGGIFYLWREAFQYVRGIFDFGHFRNRIVRFVLGNPNPRFDWPGLIYGLIPGVCGFLIYAIALAP